MPERDVSGELYFLPARGMHLFPRTPHPPRLNAAQEPAGAPKSLADGRPAYQPTHPGWLGGPGHRKGSAGGRGFAPTPNPEPPRLGGVSVSGRM